MHNRKARPDAARMRGCFRPVQSLRAGPAGQPAASGYFSYFHIYFFTCCIYVCIIIFSWEAYQDCIWCGLGHPIDLTKNIKKYDKAIPRYTKIQGGGGPAPPGPAPRCHGPDRDRLLGTGPDGAAPPPQDILYILVFSIYRGPCIYFW